MTADAVLSRSGTAYLYNLRINGIISALPLLTQLFSTTRLHRLSQTESFYLYYNTEADKHSSENTTVFVIVYLFPKVISVECHVTWECHSIFRSVMSLFDEHHEQVTPCLWMTPMGHGAPCPMILS